MWGVEKWETAALQDHVPSDWPNQLNATRDYRNMPSWRQLSNKDSTIPTRN